MVFPGGHTLKLSGERKQLEHARLAAEFPAETGEIKRSTDRYLIRLLSGVLPELRTRGVLRAR